MKKVVTVLMALLLALSLAACSTGGNDTKKDNNDTKKVSWTLKVEGVDGVETVTSEEVSAIPEKTVETTVMRKGKEVTSTYTGVPLIEVLKEKGITDFKKVTVVAEDGFSATYDKAKAESENTLISWLTNGEANENNSITAVPDNGQSNEYVQNLQKIIIEK